MTNILIVDDEKDIRDLIGDILKDEGYSIRLAGNSDDCMAEIKRLGFDALVREVSQDRPFLGICVGMQALLERSGMPVVIGWN